MYRCPSLAAFQIHLLVDPNLNFEIDLADYIYVMNRPELFMNILSRNSKRTSLFYTGTHRYHPLDIAS